MNKKKYAGFACSYTPLSIIDASGFTPFRVFPETDSPQQAAGFLHDNICPHVKKITDRAISKDLPEEMEVMIFMNSCDAMRRASDAWKKARPDHRVILLDLPQTKTEASVKFFAGELERLASFLSPDEELPSSKIAESQKKLNQISILMDGLREKNREGKIKNGSAVVQDAYNFTATHSPDEAAAHLKKIVETKETQETKTKLFLLGNMLHSKEAFMMFEESGVSIVDDDICTGSRFISPYSIDEKNIFHSLAGEILSKPPCARTFDFINPGNIGEKLAARVKNSEVEGAILHVMKFCDPYLARLPVIREEFRKKGIPLLILEGDATLGSGSSSMGQQKTRIEAFTEILG